VTEESGSLSTALPVPLHRHVGSLVVDGKLAVELLLGGEGGSHRGSLGFNDHGDCGRDTLT